MNATSEKIERGPGIFKLTPIHTSDVRPEVFGFFMPDEDFIAAYKTVRDQVIFTNKRVILVNVQGGALGKRVSYFTYPYSRLDYFGIQTSGLADRDSELELDFRSNKKLIFDFGLSVNINDIFTTISENVLK